jgi:hypothetical protein
MDTRLTIHRDNSESDNYRAIIGVVSNVEWVKIHNVMKFLGWGWGIEHEVPNTAELCKEAIRQAERMVKYSIETKNDGCTECGGIRTSTYFFQDGSIRLDIAFVLSSWDNSI